MDKPADAVKKFFSSLFDFSFKEFITDRIIKVLYALAAIYILVFCLGKFFGSFKYGAGQAFVTLISSIVIFFVLLMVARAFLEIVIILFRISENVEKLAANTSGGESPQYVIDAEVEQPQGPECSKNDEKTAQDSPESTE